MGIVSLGKGHQHTLCPRVRGFALNCPPHPWLMLEVRSFGITGMPRHTGSPMESSTLGTEIPAQTLHGEAGGIRGVIQLGA